MKTYYGGESVKGGFYFGTQQKDIIDINDNETLPGVTQNHYWKIPLVLMLLIGPLLGLLYVIFLPFISFALVLGVILKKAYLLVKSFAYELLGTATAAWRPGYSFLANLEKQEKKTAESEVINKPEDMIARLEQEIVGRRKEGQQ